MADQPVTVPNIGDAHDVDVVEVLVQPGTRVEREQPLIVLESDKASMEIPSPEAGVVRSLGVKVGDKVSEGALILTLDTDDAADAGTPKPSEKNPSTAKPAAAQSAPQASAAQPSPARAAPAAPPERVIEDKANEADDAELRVDSPAEATLPKPAAVPAGLSAAAPRAPSMARYERGPTRTIPPAPPVVFSVAADPKRKLPYASPAIRAFARELGVDLLQVTGSGESGRITKDDVERFVKHTMSSVLRPGAGAAGANGGGAAAFMLPEAPEIDFTQFGEISTQPLTKIQKVSGRNLHRSWVTIPHVTQFDEADITELEEFRKKMRADHPDLKLTLLAFFMKGLVVALKAMPRFNSSLDKSGENLILKQYFHIGIAVDTPNGLMVPVVRDVDIKGLRELAQELDEVSERARARRLGPPDLQGASMTISSLGGIGGTAFTPIINPPEVAVLGISRAAHKPVYQNGAFVPRLMCPLSLSYDHRVIDGADAARFTSLLRQVFGDIRQMLL